MRKKRKKAYVGVSGGVDSSVSLALLKEQGFDVTGVFIKVWQPEFVKSNWKEDRLDAIKVCKKLGVPFKDLDLEKEYKEKIFDYMIKEYKEGRTPNPDVMCNKEIKFGSFLDWALNDGADYVATGHYARVEKYTDGNFLENFLDKLKWGKKEGVSKNKAKLERIRMLVGVDEDKDQTYFLWTFTQEQLSRVLFPVGHLRKKKVREIAKRFGLSTADKKDSQGLCFVGMVEMRDFLKRFLPEKRGNVLNEDGEIIGYHEGSYYYTLGQRHGFIITKKTPDDKPRFIINKNIRENTITVSEKKVGKEKRISDKYEIMLRDINWIKGEYPDLSKTYKARIRYRQKLERCHIVRDGKGEFTVIFDKYQIAVSCGQSLVLYDGDICLGGGVIK